MVDYGTTVESLKDSIKWIETHQFSGWGNVVNSIKDAIEKLEEYHLRIKEILIEKTEQKERLINELQIQKQLNNIK